MPIKTENYNITNIRLNFYQIWSITMVLPRVYKNGKSGGLGDVNMYEYTFIRKKGNKMTDRMEEMELEETDENYTIYKWGDKFTKTDTWILASNTYDKGKNEKFRRFIIGSIKEYSYNEKEKKFRKDDRKIKESINIQKDILKKI